MKMRKLAASFKRFLPVLLSLLMGGGAADSSIEKNSRRNIPLDGRGGGVIAFSVDENAIYAINGDGTGLLRLSHKPGPDSGPAWSPNGDKISFTRQVDSKTWSLYIMNADGSQIQRITFDTNVHDNQPCWTLDGRILFAREYPLQKTRTEVWTVNPDGRELKRIAENGSYPSCSRDGAKIVYPVYSDGDGEIWMMNRDGSDQVKITDNQSQDWLPAWSPTGDQIVFQSNRDGNHEIYTMNVKGRDIRRLTENSFYDGYPRWSPDGTKIIFESARDGHSEIYTMNVDGSNQERLTFTNGNAYQPDWGSHKRIGAKHDDRVAFAGPVLLKFVERAGRQPDRAFNRRKGSSRPALDSALLIQSVDPEDGGMLGQPPGLTPLLFAPGVISKSGTDEWGLAVNDDWTEIFFSRAENDKASLYRLVRRADSWSEPEIAGFSGRYDDSHPVFSSDGKKLFFGSKRPCPGAREALNLWFVEKIDGLWGTPRSLGPPLTDQTVHAASVSPEGDIYATGLVVFEKGRSGYLPYRKLRPDTQGSQPAVSPDGRSIVFSKRAPRGFGGMDLHVIFGVAGGSWTEPVNLGKGVKTRDGETSPTFSRDGRFLFFSRRGDIWWVSTAALDSLKPEGLN
jgi:TolB protein